MENYQTDIQALLQDINGGYRDPGHKQSAQSPLPLAGSISGSSRSQVERSTAPRNALAPIYEQQPPYEAQASRPFETYSYSAHSDNSLDQYDRALLDEPQPHSRNANSSMGTLLAGRLSLPGHTTPHSPVNVFQKSEKHEHRRPVDGPGSYRSQPRPGQPHALPLSHFDLTMTTVRYAHTPPVQIRASSPPPEALPSSPSFMAIQRRIHHERQHDNHSANTYTSRNLRPVVVSSVKDSQKGFVHEYHPHNADVGQDIQDILFPEIPSSKRYQRRFNPSIGLNHTKPIVQGIRLVSLDEMPDRLRSVFRYPLFNAIQSKCFPTAYKTDDNLVVSAPTGGGKTAILEMAVCRLIHGFKTNQFKIVYMAPTKSLCSERQRDWQAKFVAFDLKCAELTGDTDQGQLRNVQSASIVITTPEKWDSMTRKWKDQSRLMQMVKLFLIDEVHILKDSRGATLEAVVSRMKSVNTNIRFVALSATVPNSEDIAAWLGKNHTSQHLPATREKFGEEFRPVRLQKHVVGISYKGNDFGFESACDPRLPDIIAKHSHKKPIMVFCITRKSAVNTAKLLAHVWASKGPRDRHWEGPTQRLVVQDLELRNSLISGVAFHHAGLDGPDRQTVEQGFLEGQINVVCCTSTLAVGVNLPCHMVIIKNTVSYQDDGIKEYADLEIMQMLGRAGRPQFDSTAVAVIITKQEKVKKYEKLVSGEELLESCLHLNLIDHLNAEIGLGTIYDLYTAKRWIAGTFLHVRLRLNPEHYKLDGETLAQNLDDRIERICRRDLGLLEETQLVTPGDRLKATEFGEAMARYYVKFKTMQVFMRLRPQAKISDILNAIVQAEEFHDMRLRANEKKLFREINNASGIKFPIKVDLAMHAHKRSLIIQCELGGVDFPADEQYVKHKRQFNQDKATLFSACHRLICCVIDCRIHLHDAVTVRQALELARSFGARVWDHSPLQMKQIAQIGLVAIRKLAMGGIDSIEALEATEPHRIEMLMSKNPPFGNKLLANLRDFPKPRVSVKAMGKDSTQGWPATIKIKAECGFVNDTVPVFFHRRPIYICLLTERSDGFLVDFRRIRSSKKLINSPDILMSAELLNHTQYITCFIMCDGIAGTTRSAELRPELPARSPSPPQLQIQAQQLTRKKIDTQSIGKISTKTFTTTPEILEDDEFGDDDFKDLDVMNAVKDMDFSHIDEFDSRSKQEELQQLKPGIIKSKANGTDQFVWNPERLENGKWACNHKCKDKAACKHLCCREGIDKAPRAPKSSSVSAASLVGSSHLAGRTGRKGRGATAKNPAASSPPKNKEVVGIETVDLAGGQAVVRYEKSLSKAPRNLNHLFETVTKGRAAMVGVKEQPAFDDERRGQSQILLLNKEASAETSSDKPSTDYDADWMGDLPSPSALLRKQDGEVGPHPEHTSIDYNSYWPDGLPSLSAPICQNDAANGGYSHKVSLEGSVPAPFNDNKSEVGAAMVGLSDSVTMQEDSQAQAAIGRTNSQPDAFRYYSPPQDESLPRFYHPPADKGESSGTSRLFFLTDSPEKEAELGQKRRAAVSDEAEHISQYAPTPKRPRISDELDQAPRPSSNTARQTLPPMATVRPGQPAWVYEIDPAFVAEWQDIVDFV